MQKDSPCFICVEILVLELKCCKVKNFPRSIKNMIEHPSCNHIIEDDDSVIDLAYSLSTYFALFEAITIDCTDVGDARAALTATHDRNAVSPFRRQL